MPSILPTASLMTSRGATCTLMDVITAQYRKPQVIFWWISSRSRRVTSRYGKHAGHIRLVILVIGRVVVLHQIAVHQFAGVAMVMRIVGVRARADQGKIRRRTRRTS